ncbi:MAG: hypothetical protein QXV55_04585 [Acidilobaceae archaeon]
MISRLLDLTEKALTLLAVVTVPIALLGDHLAQELLISLALSAYLTSLAKGLREEVVEPSAIVLEGITVFTLLAVPYYAVVLTHIKLESILTFALVAISTLGLLLTSADYKSSVLSFRLLKTFVFSSVWSLVATMALLHRYNPFISFFLATILTIILFVFKLDRKSLELYLLERLKSASVFVTLVPTVAELAYKLLEGISLLMLNLVPTVAELAYKLLEGISLLMLNVVLLTTLTVSSHFRRTLLKVFQSSRKLEESYRGVYLISEDIVFRLQRIAESYARADFSYHVLALIALVVTLTLWIMFVAR